MENLLSHTLHILEFNFQLFEYPRMSLYTFLFEGMLVRMTRLLSFFPDSKQYDVKALITDQILPIIFSLWGIGKIIQNV